MRRHYWFLPIISLLFVVGLISFSKEIVVQAQTPTGDISAVQAFSPESITLKGTSRLTFTISNSNAAELTAVSFSNLFPVGLSIADVETHSSTCQGTLEVEAGDTGIALTNGIVPANGSCTIAVNVVSSHSGSLEDAINPGDLTGTLNSNFVSNSNTSSVQLSVANFDFNAEINKSFNPINITPGDISRLTVSIYNPNAFELHNASWTDNLVGQQLGLYIADPANVSTTDCGVSPVVTAEPGTTTLSLSGATVPAKVGQTNGVCTVSVNVSSITSGNLINTIPGEALSSTTLDGSDTISNTDPASATLNVDSLTSPTVTKQFNPNTIWVGQTSQLTISIHNADPTHTLTNLALNDYFNDPAPYNVILASTVSPSLSTSCGPSAALTANSGSTNLSLTNAAIEPGATCTVQVNVTSNIQGVFKNTIPVGAITDQQGVSNIAKAEADLNVQAVGISKSFSPNTILAGDISTLTITLKNPTGSPYTGVSVSDVMPGSDLYLTGTPTTTCGTGVVEIGTTNRVDDTVTLSAGQVPAGTVSTPGTCTIIVDVTTANTALTKTHTNTIIKNALTADGGITNPDPASANLRINALKITIVKSFSPASFEEDGKTLLTVTLQNPTSAVLHLTNLVDTLPTGLIPNPATAGSNCINAQTVAVSGNPSTLTLSGLDGSGAEIPAGTIGTPGTCRFWVEVTAATAKTYTNTIAADSITTLEGLTNLDSASRSTTVYPKGFGLTASKTFTNDSIISGGNSRLRISVRAPDDQDISGLSLLDSLPANVTISNSTAATNSCGGLLTANTGESTISLSGGSITKGETCYINVYVTASISGTYTNTINAADISNTQNEKPPSDFSAQLTVSNLTMSKAFYPNTVAPNGQSTLTITLTNNSPSPITGVSLSDNLNTMGGTDFTIASPLKASTTCSGGTVNGSGQIFTLSNGTVPPKVGGVSGICTVNIDIQAGAIASLPTTRTNTTYRTDVSGTLSGSGTIRPVDNAQGSLTVSGLTLSVVKGFSPLTVFGGSSSTMSIQLINPNNATLSGIKFTDTMPAGMYIANPSDASKGTCGGTLTAVPNSNTITFTDGVLTAGKRCTITVSTTMNVHGNRTNTIAIGGVTSFNGASNTQAAQASLTNLPGVSVTKFFTPNTITLGEQSLLTIQIKNTSNIPLHNMALTDTLPAGLTIAASPVYTNSCNGTVTANSGTGVIKLIDGEIIAGPNTTCSIVVPVTSTTAGIYTNTIAKNALSTGEGATNDEAVSDILTINPQPNLQFSKTLDTENSDPAPYSEAAGHNQLVYSLVAKNMSDVPLTNVTIADPGVTLGTCTPSKPASLAPGESLTCSATHTLDSIDAAEVSYSNTATADSDQTDPITDTVVVPMNQAGMLSIDKIVKNQGPYQVGDTLDYEVTVTNIGSILVNHVTITDTGTSPVSCSPAQSSNLNPAEVMTCSFSHVVTKADVKAGEYINTATASGDEITTPVTDTVTVPIENNAKLEVFKQITSQGPYNTVGKTVTYDISAINTGTVTLTNVIINDPTVGVTLGTCTPTQPATLAPGEILSCSATHTITADDLTAGGFQNTAIANSDQTEEVSGSAEVITKIPTILLDKVGVLDLGSHTYPMAGDPINYTFTVTNTGEVTLTDVKLIDIVGGVTLTGDPIASLAPLAVDSTTFSGTHILTQADIDAGVFDNTASVTGVPPVGSNVSDTDSFSQNLTQNPSITLQKTGTLNKGDSRVDAGDTIIYVFTITNSGNVTLKNISISDPLITLSGSTIATLAPGASDTTTYTGTYTLTQSDVDAGTFTNTATVTSTDPDNNAVTDTDDDTQTLDADKRITFTKTGTTDMTVVAPGTLANAGDKINYTFTISNPGNVTLTNVTITDSDATISGGPITLAPGASDSSTFTGVHTLTQVEVDAGTFTNTATVTASTQTSGTITKDSSDNKTFVASPSISLVKTGTQNKTIVAPSADINAGDKINYTFAVTNTGNVTLSTVSVTDDKLGTVSGSPISSIAPGATTTLTGSHTLTQAEIDSGSYSNSATATGNPPTGDPVTSTEGDVQTLTKVAAVTLTKTGVVNMTIVAPNGVANPGDTIAYTFAVRNTGNVTLTNLSVVDTVGGVSITGSPIASLAPGVTNNSAYTGSYTLTQANINTGSFLNTARVTGYDPSSASVTNTGSTTKSGLSSPSLTITKTGTLNIGGNSRVDAGDTITYVFTVTNTGNVDLTNVRITDPKATILGGPISLAMGASDSSTFTGTRTLTQADVDAGTFTNTATVTGTAPNGGTATNTDPDTQTLTPDKQITLVKTGTLDMNVVAPNGIANAGDKINYTFTVTNPGNVTLTSVTITDPKATIIGGPITLAPGASNSATFTGSHTLTQAEVDAGTFTNTATVSGLPPSGGAITTTSSDTKTLAASPSISLVKTGTLVKTVVAPNADANAGDRVTYTFAVTNTGNVTLSAVTVTDPKIGTISGSPITSIAPGATTTLTGSHTLTQDDVDSGGYNNSAIASGNPPTGDAVTSTDGDSQTFDTAPSISLTKTGTLNKGADGVTTPGDVINYAFTITNTGNVTLSGITLSDDKATLSGGPTIASLAPNISSTVFTGTYALTQSDIDAGTFTNTATTTGNPPTGSPVSGSDNDTQSGLSTPSISLVKTGTINVGANSRVDANETITYHFTVTNTGNVALTNISVIDPLITVNGGPISLGIGASDSTTFSGTYTLSQTEINSGSLANTATVTGKPPTGSNVTDQSSVTKTLVAEKQITLLKEGTADWTVVPPADQVNVGDKISYKFTVTNPGNVTLTNVTVSDPKITVSGSAITLAPGESNATQFTGTYTIKQTDLDAGVFSNTASVSGTPPVGAPITATSTDTKSGIASPTLTVEKSGVIDLGLDGSLGAGDIVNYTFKIKNTGNVVLTNVTLTEDTADVTLNGSPIASLAIGATDDGSYTASYVLKQEDINAGSFTNTVTVTGTPPTSSDVTSTGSDKRDLAQAKTLTLIKEGTLDKTVVPLSTEVNAGDTITYKFTVQNTGNVTLTNVVVTDPLMTVNGSPIASLAPGAKDETTFSGTYTIKQEDVDLGTFNNTATVTGTPPSGDPITSEGVSSVFLTDQPIIGVAKKMVEKVTVSAGTHDVTMDILIKNFGNVTLHNVLVTDKLTDTFPLPTTFTVQSVTSSDPSLILNNNPDGTPIFNGDTDINLLKAGNTLEVGQSKTIRVVVRVIPTSYGPFLNTAWASGIGPEPNPDLDPKVDNGKLVNDESVFDVNLDPDPTKDHNPTNDQGGTPMEFGARIFDPPSGIKTLDANEQPYLKWTMVWINETNIVGVHAVVHDPIPQYTEFVSDLIDSGYGVPGSAPEGSTSLGVSCTAAEGSTATTTTLCYYEGPTPTYPRGQIIWEGTLGPDLGVKEPKDAKNAISITFGVRVENSTVVKNNAFIDSDLNGDGDALDEGEKIDATADFIWDVTPENLPKTGFAPNQISLLPKQTTTYSELGDLWLEIPKIEIKLPIVGVPMENNNWDVSWLGNQAGWLNETAYPTTAGNSVITGHVYLPNGKPGPFVDLKKLGWNDKLIIHVGNKQYIYRVRQVMKVQPDEVSTLKAESSSWITLVTCQGYDESSDSYLYRQVVKAELIEIQ